MKVKTTDLNGTPLNWAVAQCLGVTPVAVKKNYSEGWLLYSRPNATIPLEYSSKWAQGGLIIDQMMQGKFFLMENDDSCCHAAYSETEHDNAHGYGPTPLLAAMRCFVASRLGDEVDVPDELMKISS